MTGWILATGTIRGGQPADRKDRAIIVLASVAPDLDGLGIIPEITTRYSAHPLDWFSRYHHMFFHNLGFALAVTALVFIVSRRRAGKWRLAALAFLAVHLHLLEDLVGSRGPDGYQWPIPYLLPFSDRVQLTWDGQWALNAWPNVVITLVLLLLTLYLAAKQRRSPLETFSRPADQVLVTALRRRILSNPESTNPI